MKHSRLKAPLELFRNDIVRCVKCGSCRSVCPSFLQTREESLSARGRMALIKAVLENRLAVSDIYRDRLATCTGCQACEAACPSNVPVTAIIQAAREQAVYESGLGIINTVISSVVSRPALCRAAAWLAPVVLHAARGGAVRGKTEKSGGRRSNTGRTTTREHKGRVAFFPGCATGNFQKDVHRASLAVLARLGFDVVIPGGLHCCGKPLLSLGNRDAAEESAVRNTNILASLKVDAVVTTCATCSLTFKKDYPKLLPRDTKPPVMQDIHEFLARALTGRALARVDKRITWHDPCHLGRGQGLSKTARDILRSIPGLTLVEMKNPDACCGFGGVMRLTHPDLSLGIAEEKTKHIIATGADAVVTGCPGCTLQIQDGLSRAGSGIAVLHTVQVLEKALANTESGSKR